MFLELQILVVYCCC